MFTSGAGAWDSTLILSEDGSFVGNYHEQMQEIAGMDIQMEPFTIVISMENSPSRKR